MHKFVGVLQPTAEAVLETINDRRITLLVLPEVGLRCRGEVVLSTWNALLAQVRCVVTYSPRTGRARGGDVGLLGNKVVESYVEQAIFSTPGVGAGEQARLRRLRRAIDREPLRSFETYKDAPERGRRARAPGRERGAAARPSGGLAPLRARRSSCRSRCRWRRST